MKRLKQQAYGLDFSEYLNRNHRKTNDESIIRSNEPALNSELYPQDELIRRQINFEDEYYKNASHNRGTLSSNSTPLFSNCLNNRLREGFVSSSNAVSLQKQNILEHLEPYRNEIPKNMVNRNIIEIKLESKEMAMNLEQIRNYEGRSRRSSNNQQELENRAQRPLLERGLSQRPQANIFGSLRANGPAHKENVYNRRISSSCYGIIEPESRRSSLSLVQNAHGYRTFNIMLIFKKCFC